MNMKQAGLKQNQGDWELKKNLRAETKSPSELVNEQIQTLKREFVNWKVVSEKRKM